MKTLTLLLFFCVAVLVTACVYDDIGPPKALQQYYASYMFHRGGILNPNSDNIVTLKYNHLGQVIKRTGGFRVVPGVLGILYVFSKDVYDEVTYGEDVVTIDRKFTSPANIDPYKKDIFFRNDRISRIVTLNGQVRSILYPYYNSSGLIHRTIETKWWLQSEGDTLFGGTVIKDFFYESGNLFSVRGEEIGLFNAKTVTVEKFADYDAAPNPTKSLIIFDEIFYRSLSANNFRTYSVEKRNSSGYIFSSATLSWKLRYDDAGVPFYY